MPHRLLGLSHPLGRRRDRARRTDLDKLKPSLQTVKRQVDRRGGGMPSFKDSLNAAQIQAVAAYVARTAGTP